MDYRYPADAMIVEADDGITMQLEQLKLVDNELARNQRKKPATYRSYCTDRCVPFG